VAGWLSGEWVFVPSVSYGGFLELDEVSYL